MTELIISTPEQLRKLIAEAVSESLQIEVEKILQTKKNEEAKEEFLTRKQAAALFQVSLVTLSEWSKTGVVIGYRIGSRVFYKRSELEKSLIQMKTMKNRW